MICSGILVSPWFISMLPLTLLVLNCITNPTFKIDLWKTLRARPATHEPCFHSDTHTKTKNQWTIMNTRLYPPKHHPKCPLISLPSFLTLLSLLNILHVRSMLCYWFGTIFFSLSFWDFVWISNKIYFVFIWFLKNIDGGQVKQARMFEVQTYISIPSFQHIDREYIGLIMHNAQSPLL